MKVINKDKKMVETLIGEDGNAYSSSKRLLHAIKVDPNKVIAKGDSLHEGIDFEVPENEKGGIIIFSEEVNAIKQSDNKLIDWIKKKVKTLANNINYKKKIDTIANAHDLVGWTVGRFLDGRYKAKNGKMYGEKSLSVEIVGVTSETLIQIAEELARAFEQEAVLVKDYSTNSVLFVNRD